MRAVVVLVVLSRVAYAAPPGLTDEPPAPGLTEQAPAPAEEPPASGSTDEPTPPGSTDKLTPPGSTEEPPPVTHEAHEATPAAEPPPTPLASYRDQTILADGIAGGLMLVAFNTHNSDNAQAFAKLSITVYVVGAPLVHLSKNRGKRALGSMTMRLGLPVLGALLGSAFHPSSTCTSYYDSCEEDWPNEEMAYGLVVGVIAASVLDTLYLAKGEAAKPASQTAWAPTARATQGGFALGVHATF